MIPTGTIDIFDYLCKSSRYRQENQQWEDDNGLNMEFELPGFSSEEVNVSVEGNFLLIEAETERRGNKKTFNRKLKLLDHYDLDMTRVTMIDGLLTITIPREARAKPKRIPINDTSTFKTLEDQGFK